MAERRMFTMKIVDSDAFLDMPLSAQTLYFHLSMRADDDGFVNNPKKIQRMIGASDDDLKLLIAKRFILIFESGVIVIKHWRMHNLLRKDRYNPTQYQEEYKSLSVKENGAYTNNGNLLATEWQPSGNQMATQVSIGKDSKGKDSISIVEQNVIDIVKHLNERAGTKYKPTTKRTIQSINARLSEGYTVDDFFTVIDKKCGEWKGTRYEQYLTPNTLFSPEHFERYLNQNIVSDNGKDVRPVTKKPNKFQNFKGRDREENINMAKLVMMHDGV